MQEAARVPSRFLGQTTPPKPLLNPDLRTRHVLEALFPSSQPQKPHPAPKTGQKGLGVPKNQAGWLQVESRGSILRLEVPRGLKTFALLCCPGLFAALGPFLEGTTIFPCQISQYFPHEDEQREASAPQEAGGAAGVTSKASGMS